MHHTAVLAVYFLHHHHCLTSVCIYDRLHLAKEHSLGYSVTLCLNSSQSMSVSTCVLMRFDHNFLCLAPALEDLAALVLLKPEMPVLQSLMGEGTG